MTGSAASGAVASGSEGFEAGSATLVGSASAGSSGSTSGSTACTIPGFGLHGFFGCRVLQFRRDHSGSLALPRYQISCAGSAACCGTTACSRLRSRPDIDCPYRLGFCRRLVLLATLVDHDEQVPVRSQPRQPGGQRAAPARQHALDDPLLLVCLVRHARQRLLRQAEPCKAGRGGLDRALCVDEGQEMPGCRESADRPLDGILRARRSLGAPPTAAG